MSGFGLVVSVRLMSRRRWFDSLPCHSFLFKRSDLWALSCDFAPHNERNIKMIPFASHLNAEIIQVVIVYHYVQFPHPLAPPPAISVPASTSPETNLR